MQMDDHHRRQPGATLPPHALDHPGTPMTTSDYAVQELGQHQQQGPATEADEAPGSSSLSLASACLKDRVREAARWLQAAFDGGEGFARLHLAHLTFEAGQEDAALAHLKEHLSWVVQRGRDTCAGCWQTRGEDTPMLTCSGCRVARFCSADHQKMASKKAALGGSLRRGRHKDMCGVLSKWRAVVKDGVAPDSCTADLVAFLQR